MKKTGNSGIGAIFARKEKEPVVKIHWTKNGFYADPMEIVSHPNAKRQLQQVREWLQAKASESRKE